MRFLFVRNESDIPTTPTRLDSVRSGMVAVVDNSVLTVSKMTGPDTDSDYAIHFEGGLVDVGHSGALLDVLPPVLGIEIPANRQDLLERCTLGNIDPQHGGSTDTGTCAALDAVLNPRTVPSDTVLVTPRVDLDAVATMAIIQLQSTDPSALDEYPYDMPGSVLRSDVRARLEVLDRTDRFAAGAWPGVRPWPTGEGDDVWSDKGAPSDVELTAAPNWICSMVARGQISLTEAVQIVARWLMAGVPDPIEGPYTNSWDGMVATGYRCALEARRVIIQAIRSGELPMTAYRNNPMSSDDAHRIGDGHCPFPEYEEVDIEEVLSGDTHCDFVFVDALNSDLDSTSSAGLAYCLAPVSVVRRAHETVSGGVKYTVAAFDDGRLDLKGLRTALDQAEFLARWPGLSLRNYGPTPDFCIECGCHEGPHQLGCTAPRNGGWTPPNVPGRTASSPMQVGSKLPAATVLEAVRNYLIGGKR